MNEEIQTQINKLTRTLANEQQITAGQVAAIIRGLASVLIDSKKKAEKLNAATVKEVSDLYGDLEKEHEKIIKAVESQTVTVKNSVMSEMNAALKEVRMAVIDIQESKPLDGKDADEAAIANRVMEMIVMPEAQEVVMDDGATIIRKINECDDLIEDIKIEGLADLKQRVDLIASMPGKVGQPFGGGASGIKDIVGGTGCTVTKNNGVYTISAPENGDVTKVGTPANNEVGVWTGDGTLEGASSLLFDGTTLGVDTIDSMTVNGAAITSQFQAHSNTQAIIETHTHSDTAANGGVFYTARARGTEASESIVQSGDTLGQIAFVGYDGTDYATSSAIFATVDGTPGSNDMPGKLTFYTAADGSQTLTERMNIDSAGLINMSASIDMGANSIGFTMQTATGDGTTTIDWGLGNHFDFTFGAFNETFTFTAPDNPGVYTLSLKQDSVGSRTATWPASVKWPAGTAPTLTTTATTGYDIIAFRYDGTNYYGTSTLNFS